MGRPHATVVRRFLVPSQLLVLAVLSPLAPSALHAARPHVDVTDRARPAQRTIASFDRTRRDPVLARIGKPVHVDERFAVPRFLVAGVRPSSATRAANPEQAARAHLLRVAPFYRLQSEDVEGASLRYVSDPGDGGLVVAFRHSVDGVPVFRDEMKLLLDRDFELLAVSGSIPPRAQAGSVAARAFRLQAPEAIARAIADLGGAAVDRGAVHRIGDAEGGYEHFVAAGVPAARLAGGTPIRARRVYFRMPDRLVPAYHVELTAEHEAPTYVIAADDGRVLLRHDRTASDSYNYRVWAENTGIRLPHDGPQGNVPTPHPTGLPSNYWPFHVGMSLVALQNGPISTNDPWLPAGANTTSGNNVDAYVDLAAPDGFSAGDFRATTTSAGTFDRIFGLTQEPTSSNHRHASITQLFYTTNYLHDWFYDVGFNEAAGNAQLSNYGRGGVGGDPIRAEAQDYGGMNNADMMTPADGASPRMQMYLWTPPNLKRVTVVSPPSIAGAKLTGGASTNGPAVNFTADLARPNPGTFAVTATTSLSTGAGPEWVHVADVNADGRPDLSTPNYTSSTVSVLMANGSGGFLPKVDYPTGVGPFMVVTPDINADGKADMVTANFSASTISVRLGTGAGVFGAKTDLPAGTNPTSVAVGRFNNDLFDDVAVTNWGASTVSVFLGTNAGSFSPKVDYATGANPNWVAVGDLNGDGPADLVTANVGTNTISVRLGAGNGTFGAKTDYTVGSAPTTLALGDLNGDRVLDVVAANNGSNTVTVSIGNGTGGFGAAVSYAVPGTPVTVALGDANGDGLLDAVVCSDAANAVSILPNNGAGVLGALQTLAVGTSPYGVQVADVTGDGHPDIVSANFGGANVTLLTGQVTPGNNVCAPFANTLTGRVALIDRGAPCTFEAKILAAQANGAAGVVIANNTAGASDMSLSNAVTIPAFMVSQDDGAAMAAALRTGPVRVTLQAIASLKRDSAVDNLIVAHEWGHFLSSRLIGDASGLYGTQGAGLAEGWSDFLALLMAVRSTDANVASNANWNGVYAAAAHALESSSAIDNTYYFGNRRYPYSTDLAKNPLTFVHIASGAPLPEGPPIQVNPYPNFESHNSGEVWCAALWECYTSLLRATNRLTFDQARDRMRRYLVRSLQLTPEMPTYVEARDAMLMAAFVNDVADYEAFVAAFARRGLGYFAIAPDRYDGENTWLYESFESGGRLELVSIALDDSIATCDQDGYLDAGEEGRLRITLSNPFGSLRLNATTGTVTSTNPNITFPTGNAFSFPPSIPSGTTTATIRVRTSGSGVQAHEFAVQYDDPGLVEPGPHALSLHVYGNVDEVASKTETFEARAWAWTSMGEPLSPSSQPWTVAQIEPLDRGAFGPDPEGLSDYSIVSPPLHVGTGPFTFTFQHQYGLEYAEGESIEYYDGGVVEISTDGGATWSDIGGSITPGYDGVIETGWKSPIAGRPAFSGFSAGFPDFILATANLGTTYAGQTVRIRFRMVSDVEFAGYGWAVDDVAFTGITNQPFQALVAESGSCTPVSVEEPALPAELAFAIAGANPTRGSPSFRFELPKATRVTIAVYDVGGRRVATLADGAYAAGIHRATWSAGASDARPKPGVYFARMVADGRVLDRRVVMLGE